MTKISAMKRSDCMLYLGVYSGIQNKTTNFTITNLMNTEKENKWQQQFS